MTLYVICQLYINESDVEEDHGLTVKEGGFLNHYKNNLT